MKVFAGVMICLVVFAASICSADETLVGHWTFEEGGGDTVEDQSQYGNDGVIQGQADWQAGKVGKGLALVKDDQSFVEIPNSDSLSASEQITISAWIKPSSIYIGDAWQERNCIVGKIRAYYLDISETGNLASYLYGAQPEQWLLGETDMTDFMDTWVHVATVYDGSEHKLYVNGELDGSLAKSGNVTVNVENVKIGYVDNNRYFDGIIDDVMIWSRALEEDELGDILPVAPKSKLATCWATVKQSQ